MGVGERVGERARAAGDGIGDEQIRGDAADAASDVAGGIACGGWNEGCEGVFCCGEKFQQTPTWAMVGAPAFEGERMSEDGVADGGEAYAVGGSGPCVGGGCERECAVGGEQQIRGERGEAEKIEVVVRM